MINPSSEVPHELTGDRDLTGVVLALTRRGAQFDDKLADVYKDLWELATETPRHVAHRPTALWERELSLEDRRRAKVLRRLGILAFADDYIASLLEAEQKSDPYDIQPPLLELYRDSLAQIAVMNGITANEVNERQELLRTNPFAWPPFMKQE